ncbi:MAG: L-carnitine dehydrogenase [Pseudomonadota bacterium]
MAYRREIRKVGIVGTGVIGAGWAARCLAKGLDVVASDPAPGAEERLRAAVANAWPALAKLGLDATADQARLTFDPDVAQAMADVDFVQESAPEREDLKRKVHAAIDASVPADVMIASSSSGLLPSQIQLDCAHPERVLIGHPFNPVYLLPLVECLGGDKTDPDAVQTAMDFYASIGMRPLRVRKEIEGYISDRLQEAIWREALHMVTEGVASTDEIDDSIIYGPGLRWALMGPCLTFHLAGGDVGMKHMLEQFGPALKLPWTKLVAPELTDELIDRMVTGTKAQAGNASVKELEQLRDNCLIGIMQTLRQHDYAAGRVLAAAEASRLASQAPAAWAAGSDVPAPLRLYETTVQIGWVDYNNHVTDSRFLEIAGEGSEAFFRYIGMDQAYWDSGQAVYALETHMTHVKEAKLGDRLSITTQLLDSDEKRFQLYHEICNGDSGEVLASVETLLINVDSNASRSTALPAQIQAALEAVAASHAAVARPERSGRRVSMTKAR